MKYLLRPVGLGSGLLVWLVLVVGCMQQPVGRADWPGNGASCVSDDDCAASGASCDREFQVCVLEDATSLDEVVIHVSDPVTGDSRVMEAEPAAMESDDELSTVLGPAVRLRGIIVGQPQATGALAAHITFRRLLNFSGISPEPVFVESSADVTLDQDTGERYNYATLLLPGAFEVEAEPTDAAAARYPLFAHLELGEEVASQTYALAYEPHERRIRGLVVGGALAGAPVPGVRVFAYDPVDGRRISNVGLTSCPADDTSAQACGSFELLVPAQTQVFRLRLSGAEERSALPVVDKGDFSFELDANNDGELAADEIGPIELGQFGPPVLFHRVVKGMDRGGRVAVVNGATVEFRCPPAERGVTPPRQYVFSATTNQDGALVGVEGLAGPGGTGIYLRTDCDEGCYEVTVIAPADGPYASSQDRVCVQSGGSAESDAGEALAIGPRLLLSGTTVGPRGEPLAEIRVEATNSNGSSFVTTSGPDGAFSLAVDPGRYDVVFVPGAQTFLAWTKLPGRAVFADVDLGPTSLSWGRLLRGRVVRTATEGGVNGAIVEGFVADGREPGSLVRFGRTHTDSEGQYVLIVPSDP